MKKIFLLLAIVFSITALNAQTNTPVGMQTTPAGVDVPSIVVNNFTLNEPNTTAVWRMDEENYAADYKDKITGQGRTVLYDRDGNLMRRDYEVEYTVFPASVGQYYSENFPKEKYIVWSSEDSGGNLLYYYSYHDYGKMVWFDKDGKYSPNKPIKGVPVKNKTTK